MIMPMLSRKIFATNSEYVTIHDDLLYKVTKGAVKSYKIESEEEAEDSDQAISSKTPTNHLTTAKRLYSINGHPSKRKLTRKATKKMSKAPRQGRLFSRKQSGPHQSNKESG